MWPEERPQPLAVAAAVVSLPGAARVSVLGDCLLRVHLGGRLDEGPKGANKQQIDAGSIKAKLKEDKEEEKTALDGEELLATSSKWKTRSGELRRSTRHQ